MDAFFQERFQVNINNIEKINHKTIQLNNRTNKTAGHLYIDNHQKLIAKGTNNHIRKAPKASHPPSQSIFLIHNRLYFIVIKKAKPKSHAKTAILKFQNIHRN